MPLSIQLEGVLIQVSNFQNSKFLPYHLEKKNETVLFIEYELFILLQGISILSQAVIILAVKKRYLPFVEKNQRLQKQCKLAFRRN